MKIINNHLTSEKSIAVEISKDLKHNVLNKEALVLIKELAQKAGIKEIYVTEDSSTDFYQLIQCN